MHGFSIGKLARAARVSVDTIRYYERCGLLPQPARHPSGFRKYSELDLRQLRRLRSARQLGFSLEEIAELLALESATEAPAARMLIHEKLTVIDMKIRELQRWRSSLSELVRSQSDHLAESDSILDVFESAVANANAIEESCAKPDERSL